MMTPDGYIKITDRTKDLIKSGGEWISSVELENALMTHPKVFEAAVVAIPHEKWLERPLACVVPKPEYKDSITKEELLDSLRTQFHKTWIPDDVVFLDEVPKTSVGKFMKAKLRENLKDYRVKI
ncbi:Fatty-acid--CoA ligase OS=Lysinibacillus sphaericus OX=1421 GN=LS41612_15555 PE=3 SV=1 [Lysinibacillus sphaericus]